MVLGHFNAVNPCAIRGILGSGCLVELFFRIVPLMNLSSAAHISSRFQRYSALILVPIICGPALSIAPALPSLANSPQIRKPAVRTGLPGRRTGGGVRAQTTACTKSTGEQTLTAIVPQDAAVKTIEQQPNLMFFVPPGTAPRQGELILKGASGTTLDRQTIPIGIDPVFLELPATNQALAPDEAYQWQFKLRCDDAVALLPNRSPAKTIALTKASPKPKPASGEESGLLMVHGSLTRVNPLSLTGLSQEERTQLKEGPPLDRVSRLIKAGLWSDAVATVCKLVTDKSTPTAIKSQGQATWKEMLSTLDLAPLRSQPMARMMIRAKVMDRRSSDRPSRLEQDRPTHPLQRERIRDRQQS